MKVAFYTLGCKVNQYETDALITLFKADGFDVVSHTQIADVYIVNSCTVTSTGDKKTRQIISRFKRMNESAKIALIGCFSQAFPEKAMAIDGVDIVKGTKDKKGVLQAVKDSLSSSKKLLQVEKYCSTDTFEEMAVTSFNDKTRAFVKIQDGCDRFCSYCIIPLARGRVRSKRLADIVSEVTAIANAGYEEVVLVGINLSSYGKDTGHRLLDAIVEISKIDNIKRIRLGSLEPELLLEEDIKALSKIEQFCPQFHLSLQSGCDETLARMNRHYDTKEYKEIVENIRKYFDNPAITTDIMVGFAGETEEEFNQTISFVKDIKFAQMHVFPYSIREGTRAASRVDHVAASIRTNRAKAMGELERQLNEDFLRTQIGKVCSVLFENTQTEFGTEGYTKNYTPVYVKSEHYEEQLGAISGKIFNVKITQVIDHHCIGEIIL